MVRWLSVRISLVFLAVAWANPEARWILNLAKTALQQLNTSSDHFDTWSGKQSAKLSQEHQQRVALNVKFLNLAKTAQQLRLLQERLSPDITEHNPFKLKCWISFYWQLHREHMLGSNRRILMDFALKLRQLQTDPQWHSGQVQNMVQSLPSTLTVLARSRWLCLLHNRDLLYVLTDGALELGANSRCSMWQLVSVDSSSEWLRLENLCEMHSAYFVNFMQQADSDVFLLQSAPGNASSIYCVRNEVGFYLARDEQEHGLTKDCYWQINDCTRLPAILNS